MHNREQFEKWLLEVHGLTGTWNDERNCYDEFACHLAYKAWQASEELQKSEIERLGLLSVHELDKLNDELIKELEQNKELLLTHTQLQSSLESKLKTKNNALADIYTSAAAGQLALSIEAKNSLFEKIETDAISAHRI